MSPPELAEGSHNCHMGTVRCHTHVRLVNDNLSAVLSKYYLLQNIWLGILSDQMKVSSQTFSVPRRTLLSSFAMHTGDNSEMP